MKNDNIILFLKVSILIVFLIGVVYSISFRLSIKSSNLKYPDYDTYRYEVDLIKEEMDNHLLYLNELIAKDYLLIKATIINQQVNGRFTVYKLLTDRNETIYLQTDTLFYTYKSVINTQFRNKPIFIGQEYFFFITPVEFPDWYHTNGQEESTFKLAKTSLDFRHVDYHSIVNSTTTCNIFNEYEDNEISNNGYFTFDDINSIKSVDMYYIKDIPQENINEYCLYKDVVLTLETDVIIYD